VYSPLDSEILKTKEIFINKTSLEIVSYLEYGYQSIQTIYFLNKNKCRQNNDEIFAACEKILLDKDNELIDYYLARFCRSNVTMDKLLQKNTNYLNEAIYNVNCSSSIINKIALDEELLTNYFSYWLLKEQLPLEFSYSFQPIIESFLDKNENHLFGYFEHIPEDMYFRVLDKIAPFINIRKRILIDDAQRKKNAYDAPPDLISHSLWRLLEKLDVNSQTIKLFSGIGDFPRRICELPYKRKLNVDQMLDKWSGYEYSDNDEGFEQKVAIQMLINSFSEEFQDHNNFLKSKYDGVRAYYYKYGNFFWGPLKESSSKEVLKKFVHEVFDKDPKNASFIENNFCFYSEKFFPLFHELFTISKSCAKQIINNFEEIGKSIVVLDRCDIKNILSNAKVNEKEQKYYYLMYNIQKLHINKEFVNKIMEKQESIVDIISNKKISLW